MHYKTIVCAYVKKNVRSMSITWIFNYRQTLSSEALYVCTVHKTTLAFCVLKNVNPPPSPSKPTKNSNRLPNGILPKCPPRTLYWIWNYFSSEQSTINNTRPRATHWTARTVRRNVVSAVARRHRRRVLHTRNICKYSI